MATYEELFEAIKVELQKTPEEFTSLLDFAEKKYRNRTAKWCKDKEFFIGGDLKDDLFISVFIKLCKTTKRYFFCRNGETFDESKTLHEFHRWTKTVYTNELKDFFRKNCFWAFVDPNNPLGFSENPFDDEDEGFNDAPDKSDAFELSADMEYYIMGISKAVDMVFDLRTEPHMVLSWLAVSVVMLNGKYYRHEVGKVVDMYFGDKSLYEMFDYLIPNLKQLPWFNVSNERLKEQRAKLDVIHEETHKPVGEMRFCEFYQKKGGRASISEWFTRTSNQIIKKI